MISISMLLFCLSACLDSTTLRQLTVIVPAIFSMPGRITMLGISRWTDKGGSYRTIQRFYHTSVDWAKIHWIFFQTHFLNNTDTYILAGDEVVTTKSGKSTHGLDRFFSSLAGKTVPGLSFITFSLINVDKRVSYPIKTEQIIRQADKPQTETQSKPDTQQMSASSEKRPVGRPKGSKNKKKEDVELSSHLLFIKGVLFSLLSLIGAHLRLTYLVFDGAFGHNAALQMTRQCGLHLVSKLQANAELYFKYDGPYSGRGPYKKYGDKIDFDNIPEKYLKETWVENGIKTCIFQMEMLHKLFPQALNIVVIHKTNLKTGAKAHVVLFSSDLKLAYDKLIEYYKLRFQIEFNFRDAKQYWGLEDFMNVKETPVTNAVNLSLFLCNLSRAWIDKNQTHNPKFSAEDLKAHFRGQKYVQEILKLLPEKPDHILISQIQAKIATIGGINT